MSPNPMRTLLTALLAVSIAACGGTDTGVPGATPEPHADTTLPGAPTTPADVPPTEDISPAPWDAARDRGAAWRGIGQEPGWTVEIHPRDRIVYLGDYGETTITLPAGESRQDGRVQTWHASGNGNDLRVQFEEVSCQDVMSGEEMPYTVTITVNGTELRGCGRRLH
jgi:uncharacterized membrane protein